MSLIGVLLLSLTISCTGIAQTLITNKEQQPLKLQETNKDTDSELSQGGDISSKEIENKLKDRVKDPFTLPNHLYLTLKKKLGDAGGEGYVDESVEPQRRWALKYYRLMAIIWNVKNPKAMITDKKQTFHMFQVGDKIGNGGAVITSIGNGQVGVLEKEKETVLKMTDATK